MIKCFVSDLDGTLLDKGKLSDFNRQAVLQILNEGKEFMIATGRDMIQVQPIFQQFGFFCDAILLNGALFHSKDQTLTVLESLNEQEMKKASDIILSCGLGMIVYTKDRMMAYRSKEIVVEDFYQAMQAYDKNMFSKDFYLSIEDVNDFDEMMAAQPLNIEVMTTNDQALEKVIRQLSQIEGLYITSSIPKEIEIVSSKVSKGAALKKIAQMKELDPNEILVMGDSGNDLSMFENFPYSVAMKESVEAIKEKAYEIGESCEDNGAGKAILKWLNK